ncbi:MAG: hypothetical protein JNK48_26450 [Bryobacterales bacterium]|nr:hypothetical protein [Bryobacterales bacterium]
MKRSRSDTEVIGLIVLWRLLRRWDRFLPVGLGKHLLQRPSRRIRILRVFTQLMVTVLPDSVWYATHIGTVWRRYRDQNHRGEALARNYLLGTDLIPAYVAFPETRVRVKGWPFWLTVDHATERAECTLHQRLNALARDGRFDEIETWLHRFLDLRQRGWQLGLFSVDAHLKNFGVVGDRVVLIDSGGLTDEWHEVENKLAFEDVAVEPHIQLGLGPVLGARPDIAQRFNARWKQLVCVKGVRRHWQALRPVTAPEGV